MKKEMTVHTWGQRDGQADHPPQSAPSPWGMEEDGGVLGVPEAQLRALHLGKATAQLEGGQGTAAAKGKGKR